MTTISAVHSTNKVSPDVPLLLSYLVYPSINSAVVDCRYSSRYWYKFIFAPLCVRFYCHATDRARHSTNDLVLRRTCWVRVRPLCCSGALVQIPPWSPNSQISYLCYL